MKLSKYPPIKFFLSLRLTVAGLLMLFVLTFWGTLDQVDHGLYDSTKRFFHSWFVFAWGIIPFPGGQLVQWVLFTNLFLVTCLRIPKRWDRAGLFFVHVGLLSLLVGGFWTFKYAIESHVTLREGEQTSLSSSYHDWELSLWANDNSASSRRVTAYDLKSLDEGTHLAFEKLALSVEVEKIFVDCTAGVGGIPIKYANASGVSKLTPRPLSASSEERTPGVYLLFKDSSGSEYPVVLYGGETLATQIKIKEKTFSVILRRCRSEIPVQIKLLDVIKEDYPGTSKPKSYESHVEVGVGDERIKVRIYMNHPYRIGDYTFFQSGYAVDENGETTTLAVVKNSGRLIPYISSLMTTFGLLVHFLLALMKAFKKRRRL